MIVGKHMAIAKKAFDKFTLADIIADLPQKGQINITVSVPDIRGRVIIAAEEEVKDDSKNPESVGMGRSCSECPHSEFSHYFSRQTCLEADCPCECECRDFS